MISVDQQAPTWFHIVLRQINAAFLAIRPDNAVKITGGTINGTTIGATTPAAGTFTTLAIAAGAVIAGTYLPTITAVANVAASTAYACQYIRVGNVVTVSGKVDVDPTAAVATKLGISLPIASTLSAIEKCAGTAAASGIAGLSAAIEADIVNNRAQMEWVAVDISNQPLFFTFTYLVT